MKKLHLFYYLFCVFMTQAQSEDSFNPFSSWTGDTSKFEIKDEFLHLNDSTKSGPSSIFLPSNVSQNATWELTVKMDFRPSFSNSIDIILLSDTTLPEDFNGYYLHIGSNGSNDAIEFRKQTGTNHQLLGEGIKGRFSSQLDSFRIHVNRDSLNQWIIRSNTFDSNGLTEEITLNDSSYLVSKYFGLNLNYTSTRADKFYFNNLTINGNSFQDRTPPTITATQIIAKRSIQVFFNEIIKQPLLSNFSLDNTPPDSIHWTENKVILYFQPFIENSHHLLHIQGICDQQNNSLNHWSDSIIFHKNSLYDLLISEVYAFPTESSLLPQAEYVEIFNPSSIPINLHKWSINDLTSESILPDFSLQPNTFTLLINEKDSLKFNDLSDSVHIIFLNHLPSLNNESDVITLKDSVKQIIHSFPYNKESYKDASKANGGYSLELSDVSQPCLTKDLIKASMHVLGGSPGFHNAEAFSHFRPGISFNQVSNDTVILSYYPDSILYFNTTFNINSTSITHYEVTSNTNSILLPISFSLDREEEQILEVTNFQTCSNVSIDTAFTFYLTSIPNQGELTITEILFEPESNYPEYLELYNNSSEIFDLSDMILTSTDLEENTERWSLSFDSTLYLLPNQYYILTSNATVLQENYETIEENIIEISLPPLKNESDWLKLITHDSLLIDEVIYNTSYHSNLFTSSERKGKALERIDIEASGLFANNWFTSSAQNNFGSPTIMNSQHNSSLINTQDISFNRLNVSPDGDGFEDFILLNLINQEVGTVLNISLYNLEGVFEQKLIHNEIVGVSERIKIDFSKDGFNPNMGIHILIIELNSLDGSNKRLKKAITINKRF